MRIVLDTNVFVSAVFFGGVPGRILEAWRDGRLQLVLSAAILDEYQRVGQALSTTSTRNEVLESRLPSADPPASRP